MSSQHQSGDDQGDSGGGRLGRSIIGWVVFIGILLLLNFVVFPLFGINLVVY